MQSTRKGNQVSQYTFITPIIANDCNEYKLEICCIWKSI